MSKDRTSRISFCEWNSESFGSRNIGGIICESCNFSRTLKRGETYSNYEINNKIDRDATCPNCNETNWFWLPPIARVPKLTTSKSVWKQFWVKLKNREFNHGKTCR